jgi:hypothetical protein
LLLCPYAPTNTRSAGPSVDAIHSRCRML